eukprot:TRINITY_DN1159_c0_g1_i2.p1 TRINITY_DN1159_c0_g1~~TRINITY_DN1159_c0_g1_i2.p1  ORF type:complete len:349 (-),score=80.12 TRINITY_DN1159_c0_g1_i2:1747-2793(-)
MSAVVPPISGSDTMFDTAIKRTPLLDQVVRVSIAYCWEYFFHPPDAWSKFGETVGWREIFTTQWTKANGYLERKSTWSMPLVNFGVSQLTSVIQFQRAKYVNTDLLVIELSSTTPEVFYGTNFSVEQRWEISKISENKSLVKVSSGVFWNSEPWGSGIWKGVIDSRSTEETKNLATGFLALVEENSKMSSVGRSPPKKLRARKKTGEERVTKQQPEGEGISSNSVTKEVQSTPLRHQAIEDTWGSRLKQIFHQLMRAGQRFMVSSYLQGLCMLTFMIFVCAMFTRIAVLEKQLELPQDSIHFKILFLEKFISEIANNLTSKPNLVEESYQLWKFRSVVELELSDYFSS